MDQIAVHLLSLTPSAYIGYAILCWIIGGIAGALLLTVKISFRRISYLWFMAGTNLGLSISQFGWVMLPGALDDGYPGQLLLAMMGCIFVAGVATYFASAARSIHICGSTERAWMGFVPLANLWLFFARGEVSPGVKMPPANGWQRWAMDPALVFAGLIVLALGNAATQALEDRNADAEADAINRFISRALPMQDSLARKAAIYDAELPLRIDEITVLKEVSAQGDTLRMIYDLKEDIGFFRSDFDRTLALQLCRISAFGADISRGGKIAVVYNAPNGRIVGEFLITQDDCVS